MSTTLDPKEQPLKEQTDLFGGPPADAQIVRPVVPAPQLLQVAQRLPKNLHLGTSSLSFPGWEGIVYAEQYRVAVLARYGLRAYAQHPLLNALNIDSTFYRPQTAEQLSQLAADVPDNFRFIVKAYTGLTTAPDTPRAQQRGIEPVFLDPLYAEQTVITPLVTGLGPKLGAILFQFSPLGSRYTRDPETFVARLGEFLSELPRGPVYAVELRDPEILGAHYEDALAAAGAVHCSTVHSRMPPVDGQVLDGANGPMIIRWMLQPGDDYESAGARFAPFNRIAEPDKLSRSRIAGLVKRGLSSGRDVYVMAANNAEGSAPLTLFELATSICP
ncbi:MAG TPA: DUF72 domain-containing protein [Steroidobacteraceae bacterium]|jgi:uncharacterized protein YecE (DUF72 family)|nr:DUF72 domain-containing protein [Steroidobacteraceae bacterium]